MKLLTMSELKNVMGGVAAATVSCNGQVGTWEYTTVPTCEQVHADVIRYCRSGEGTMAAGGSCTVGGLD